MARSRIIAAVAALVGSALMTTAPAVAGPAQAADDVSATQLWRMVGVTPMLGQNDDGGIFDQTGARNLVSFAKTNHLGELSFWEVTRDRNACNGALYACTNVTQQPYEFSKIFAGYTG